MARSMMKCCGGVPLAIRALGDLLRDKSTTQWKEIETSHLWTKVDEYGILPSLRLSYDYLPHTLKICFAYCAIFEEDEVINKKKLICMWMAQGFLHPHEKMEDKGEEYIEHMLNISLFQEAKMDKHGEVETFKMHDLVWSLARVVSKGEFLCLNKDENSNKVRHLLVLEHSNRRKLSLTSFKKLRTCFIYNSIEHPSLHYLLDCRHLRALNIGLNRGVNLEWEPLGSLIHLRYLEISVKNSLVSMPFNLAKHVIKLFHLQTLCLNNIKLTDSTYPKEIGKLVNLRHILYDSEIGVPAGLFHLTDLQTLPAINLSYQWGGRLSDLGLLTNLRGKLKISNLYVLNGKKEARDLALDNKSYLECLKLDWGHKHGNPHNPYSNEILEAFQPHANLKLLKFEKYDGFKFSRWMMGEGGSSLPNLVHLEILNCRIAEGNLKLENFGSLCFLRVEGCEKLSITLPKEGFGGRKSLEILRIRGCNEVENPTGLGNLPCLRELHTDELELVAHLSKDSPVCKSLEILSLFGSSRHDGTTALPDQLQHLKSLQCLMITDFKSLATIPEWLRKLTSLKTLDLEGLPNMKKLPSEYVMQQFYTFTGDDFCPLLKEEIRKSNNAYSQKEREVIFGKWSDLLRNLKHLPSS